MKVIVIIDKDKTEFVCDLYDINDKTLILIRDFGWNDLGDRKVRQLQTVAYFNLENVEAWWLEDSRLYNTSDYLEENEIEREYNNHKAEGKTRV